TRSPDSILPYLAPSLISPLSLHDALPISIHEQNISFPLCKIIIFVTFGVYITQMNVTLLADKITECLAPELTISSCHFLLHMARSEEHTSELQSRENLVCRLLLEKKKKKS